MAAEHCVTTEAEALCEVGFCASRILPRLVCPFRGQIGSQRPPAFCNHGLSELRRWIEMLLEPCFRRLTCRTDVDAATHSRLSPSLAVRTAATDLNYVDVIALGRHLPIGSYGLCLKGPW